MLTLKKRHPMVRYAFLMSDRYKVTGPPETVTLCSLFWRCVWQTVVIVGPIMFFGSIGYAIWTAPARPHESLPGWAWLLIVVALTLTWMLIYAAEHPDSLLGVIFWAIKNRVCPLIHLQTAKGDDAFVYDAVPPTVRDVVKAMRNAGFATIETADALVAVETRPSDLAAEAYRLHNVLEKSYPAQWRVTAGYEPAVGASRLYVMKAEATSA